jgi:Cu2+-exporting ATPase
MTACQHCGTPVPAGTSAEFCCSGCEAAYHLVRGLGLSSYYQRRCIDPTVRPLRPEEEEAAVDYSAHLHEDAAAGTSTLHLMIEGIHCAACVWLIEALLSRQPGVTTARVNMTTRRLTLTWTTGTNEPTALIHPVLQVGYRLIPYDPARLSSDQIQHEKELLRAMAVAGFAAGNVMLLSVSVWAGHFSYMGDATRTFMHWVSALIALPAVAYSGRPFFRSALTALRNRRTNMDVPISIGVFLTSAMSLWETIHHGEHAYFDAAISLLFFLLIGRYLDLRARGRARSAAEHLLGLSAAAVTVIDEHGHRSVLPPTKLAEGMTVLVATGERIGVDGKVSDGLSDVDTSLLTGETNPTAVRPGDRVFAGTLNLSAPLRITVAAVGERTLLAEIVRMMEVAEQGRARYVALADRVARYYAPVVHLAALLTFLGWIGFTPILWQPALMIAVSVLIITCPCALALAVPVVQVVASGRLLRRGILLKSATALERVTVVDTVVFDKTGTLTLGRPELAPATDGVGGWTADDLALAASLAATSHHPLARALVRAAPPVAPAAGVIEHPGQGLQLGEIRLGSRRWIGADDDAAAAGPELWFSRPGHPALRFAFSDALRPDAVEVVAQLAKMGLRLELLSGDRPATVRDIAERLGIADWRAGCSPADKCARLGELTAAGRHVLMVGDGLNDAPALAAAHVSLSPSTAVDVSQTVADIIFQGLYLAPVVEVVEVARKADRLVKQNFALSFLYNLVTVPMAVLGMVTPLIAAVAMSSSSVVVIVNALRLARTRTR